MKTKRLKNLFLLLLLLLVSSIGFGQTFTVDGLNYNIISTNPNEVEVTGGTFTNPLIIPNTVTNNGTDFTVTTIVNDAFRNDGVTSVSIPNSVTLIGRSAFRDNQLTNVTIPNSVITIGNDAFRGNQLTSIVIPDSVTTLQIFAFGDNQLTSVRLGNSVSTIERDVFRGNPNLVEVISNNTNPAVISGIRDPFGDIRRRIALTVPNTTEPAAYETAGWTGFFSVNGTINVGVAEFVAGDGFTYRVISTSPNEVSLSNGNNAQGAVNIPSSVTNDNITFSVTAVGSQAFRNNDLTSLVIPTSITTINADAFRGTRSLVSVTSNAANAPSLATNAFREGAAIRTLMVPNGSESSYGASGWTNNFFSTNGVPRVGAQFTEGGFSYNVIAANPNEVSLINGNDADGAINIPSSVTVNNITFNVTEIGTNAFRSDNLTSVVIPASITTMNTEAFRNNRSLVTVTSNAASAPSLGSSVFREGPEIRNLNIPNGSESSYEAAGWSGNFFLINGVPRVGAEFTEGGFIYRVTAANPNEVSLVDGNGADGAVNIPSSVTINNVTFSVTDIGNNAFRNDNLTSVVIPASVTNINDGAFRNTRSLVTFTSNAANAPSLGSSVFREGASIRILNIPDGSESSYEAAGWINNFFLVNGVARLEARFNDNGFTYEVTSANPNTAKLVSGNNASGDITIPDTVTINNIIFNVTVIGQEAFRDDNITSVTIGTSVQEIEAAAFRNTVNLTAVISNNTQPPVLNSSAFREILQNKSLTIPNGSGVSYAEAGWNQFFSSINGIAIDSNFIVDGLEYEIFSTSPGEVTLVGGTPPSSDLTIPASVSDGTNTFSVVAIGNSAFESAGLTSVIFPNTLRQLGEIAFRSNALTDVAIPEGITQIPQRCFSSNDLESVTLPNSLESINFRSFERNEFTEIVIPGKVTQIAQLAFDRTPLTSVTSFNPSGPSVAVGTNDDSFSNESNIDLFIPTGASQSYENAGWVGFKSITEVNFDGIVSLKVFLQGAATNPTSGETALMRDNLRTSLLIPFISPYQDALAVNDTIALENTTGPDAIVDWVFVELRDPNDNSIIMESRSALLQRDGDIVDTDGVSPLNFIGFQGDFFITINHRNHLGIITADPVTLSNTPISLDFVSTTNLVEGGTNAMASVGDNFTIISGDINEDGQILNDDTNDILGSIGVPGYNNIDLDMDGQTLNRDLNIVRTNIGLGQRF